MSRPSRVGTNILETLKVTHILSAKEILEDLENQQTKVNKTSVYRALEKLIKQGFICKQTLSGDDFVYELRDHHHDHLVCERCGCIESVKCETRSPSNTGGFLVSHHHTTFLGLCKNCHT